MEAASHPYSLYIYTRQSRGFLRCDAGLVVSSGPDLGGIVKTCLRSEVMKIQPPQHLCVQWIRYVPAAFIEFIFTLPPPPSLSLSLLLCFSPFLANTPDTFILKRTQF